MMSWQIVSLSFFFCCVTRIPTSCLMNVFYWFRSYIGSCLLVFIFALHMKVREINSDVLADCVTFIFLLLCNQASQKLSHECFLLVSFLYSTGIHRWETKVICPWKEGDY